MSQIIERYQCGVCGGDLCGGAFQPRRGLHDILEYYTEIACMLEAPAG